MLSFFFWKKKMEIEIYHLLLLSQKLAQCLSLSKINKYKLFKKEKES